MIKTRLGLQFGLMFVQAYMFREAIGRHQFGWALFNVFALITGIFFAVNIIEEMTSER